MVLSLSTVNRVEEIVGQAQVEGRAPAIIAAIVRDGTVAHVASAGEPLPDRDLQFRIGSISKSLTAALVLGLRDEKRLDLDDRIGQYLPELDAAVGALRLRQLLAHVGGLQREPDGDWWERSAGPDLDGLVSGVTSAKVAFGPYAGFHYSNLAYGLLGGVVETLTGQSWAEAVTRRLLTPLGMRRTTYLPEEPYARGYVVHPWHGTLREEPRHDAGAMAPAGQLWSTADDLARWAAALASPHAGAMPASAALPTGAVLSTGASLPSGAALSAGIVAEMATPVVLADPDAWTAGYGLGLQMWRRADRVFAGHTGSMPGYLAVVVVHRASRTGVVAFANAYSLAGLPIGALGLSILEAVLDLEPAPSPTLWRAGSPPPPRIEPLCGRWWWMGREFQMCWDAHADQLVLEGLPSGEQWRFTETGADRWLGLTGDNAGEILTVLRDTDDAVAELDIATFLFSRDPLPPT